MISTILLTLLGCNPEKNYLKRHNVILCFELSDNFIDLKVLPKAYEFEKRSNISFKQASEIYTKFLYERKEIQELEYDRIIYPKVIIDGNYVYSFYNEKTMRISVAGIWVNANTGEISRGKEDIWLSERNIKK